MSSLQRLVFSKPFTIRKKFLIYKNKDTLV